MIENRASTRREVVLPCQVVREHDFKLIADRTLDLSTGGMLVPLRTPVLTGESLIVSFSIPGMWIDAEATIARVVHGRRPGDDGVAIGIVFDCLPRSARAALAGHLHGRRSPLPRRGPLSRLRRGEQSPTLADDAIVQLQMPEIVMPTDDGFVDPSDIFEEEDVVDGLGVLRAVVDAWQSLGAAEA